LMHPKHAASPALALVLRRVLCPVRGRHGPSLRTALGLPCLHATRTHHRAAAGATAGAARTARTETSSSDRPSVARAPNSHTRVWDRNEADATRRLQPRSAPHEESAGTDGALCTLRDEQCPCRRVRHSTALLLSCVPLLSTHRVRVLRCTGRVKKQKQSRSHEDQQPRPPQA
jgi:hypothetical protein